MPIDSIDYFVISRDRSMTSGGVQGAETTTAPEGAVEG
jgi:hypothetical protein